MSVKLEIPHLQVVTVLMQPPRLRDQLAGHQGIVVGRSDPQADGRRDYAVHFNHLGQVRSIPEEYLRAVGRQARPDEIVSRSIVGRIGRTGTAKRPVDS